MKVRKTATWKALPAGVRKETLELIAQLAGVYETSRGNLAKDRGHALRLAIAQLKEKHGTTDS